MNKGKEDMIVGGIIIGLVLIVAIWYVNGQMSQSHFKPPPPPPTDAENWQEVRRQMGLR